MPSLGIQLLLSALLCSPAGGWHVPFKGVRTAPRLTLRVGQRGRTRVDMSMADDGGMTAFEARQQKWDYSKAVKLAAFSFSVYGDPTGGKWFRCSDGTDISFQSDELVRATFSHLLQVHLICARDLPEEASFVERTLTGSDCDPYVITKVTSGDWSDIAVTEPKVRNRNPDFYERFLLWLNEPSTANLEFTVKEKNLIKDDEHIGYCQVPLSELIADEDQGEWSGWLDLEPFVPEERRNTAHNKKRKEQAKKRKEQDSKKPSGWLGKLMKRDKPQERIEVELTLIPLGGPEEEEAPDDEAEGSIAQGPGPKSLLDDIDWNVLGARVGGAALQLGRYKLCCFLNNKETDTQGGIWVDWANKVLIYSFRGTEITWKDLLTDMLIMQQPLEAGKPDILVHAGFLRAWKSVQVAVHTALSYITKDNLEGWTIYTTGHSLGGALATLAAYDIAGLHPELAPEGRLAMYSYGAPRVGNPAFCREYDRRLKATSFRVMNNLDIIAKMPRASQPVFEYQHAGRSVLMGEDLEEVWVEDESPGPRPAGEVDSPFAIIEAVTPKSNGSIFALPSLEEMNDQLKNPLASFQSSSGTGTLADLTRLPMSIAAFGNGSTASISDMLKIATNVTNLQALIKEPTVDMTKLAASWPSLSSFSNLDVTKMNMTDTAMFAARAMGFNTSFFDSELKLMESIVAGAAIAHHMEAKYYVALEKAYGRLSNEVASSKTSRRA